MQMLKVCFCAKQVDGSTASSQILTAKKKDSIKPPTLKFPVLCYAGLALFLSVDMIYF
jgi:hypothetical protein